MRSIWILILALMIGISTGCASSQTKAYRAQEKVHTQRLKLIDDYKKCLKEAGEDKLKVEGCGSYLKAAEALK